jgi:hypothetical protein
MKLIKYLMLILVLTIAACSPLALKPADFSWPLESVLKVGEDGFVKEDRHALFFNTQNMFLEETEDSTSHLNKEIRIIRDTKGYYYITSDNFKNVYVFNVNDGELCIDSKIQISETGIGKPAFNQRPPYIELVEGGRQHLLTNDGLQKEEEDED